MDELHIKFEFSNAIILKKNLLSAQLSFLNILQKLKSYQGLRENEFLRKQKLFASFKNLETSIGLISKQLPKMKNTNIEEIREITSSEIRTKSKIEDELHEIKRQIERLNSI